MKKYRKSIFKRTRFGRKIKIYLLRCLIFSAGCVVLFFLLNVIFPLPDRIQYSTIIRDRDGEMINAYLTPDQKWRMKTELNEISPLLRKTIIAKEDQYFYYHPGVNLVAMARALFRNTIRMKRTSGASTITMQVARMLEPKKRTWGNKLIELFRAFQLEWKYSKDEILQLYLNMVPYGGNIEGVKSASLLYFNKNPDHLSLAEITALSIIPNRPSSLVMGRNNALITEERNRWLRKFADDGVFTKREIQDALAEPLDAHRHSVPHYAPHLAQKLRHTGSLSVQTHINLNTQLKSEKLVSDYVRSLRLKNIHNAAVVVIDNRNQQVITYIGSADFYDTLDGGQVNGAAAVRQPGSTLKPLLYSLAMDEGLITPKRVLTDVAVNYDGYNPENYDRQFNGYVTVEYALEHSLNIPAVKTLAALGKERMIRRLSDAGFTQIQKDQRKLGLSLVLGGCGSTLEELTGLFAAFAHEGIYLAPSYYRADSARQPRRLFSKAAGYMTTEILSKVNRPDFPLNWSATEHLPKIAWKTGTSYGRRDAWSIGYNKHFTVGVWVGNFSGLGVPDLSGANVATPLLFRIFNTIDYDNDGEWFLPPDDLDNRKVCSETGLVAGPHCEHVILDEFIPLISSTRICDNYKEVMVSADERISYCSACAPNSGYKRKWYQVVEPDMQHWMGEHGMAYRQIPPHNPDCEKIFKGSGPAITSPLTGSEYLIDKKDPEPLQLSCRVSGDVTRVYWYIDNKFFKSAPAGEKLFFVPGEGAVKISCSDDKGRNTNCWIQVRRIRL